LFHQKGNTKNTVINIKLTVMATTQKTIEERVENIAQYIINMVKSVHKDKNYAISIISWYSYSDKEDKQIEEYINKNW
jgi:hypothetical protein